MAKKGKRINVKLKCTEGSGHFYTTQTNQQNNSAKLELKKYNPKLKRHVVYKEDKLK